MDPGKRILAIDCDLHCLYAVTDTGEVVCKGAKDIDDILSYLDTVTDVTVLFEVASAHFYRESPKAVYNTCRWALWNMAQASALEELLSGNQPIYQGIRMKVSPSSKWTLGHPLATRHAIAKCVQPQKDLRECEAMIAFYRSAPQQWCSMPDYLDNI